MGLLQEQYQFTSTCMVLEAKKSRTVLTARHLKNKQKTQSKKYLKTQNYSQEI